jgi:hypothetical protein
MKPETAEKVKFGVWGLICGAVIAIIIGFALGGWVTGGTAQTTAEAAVIERLAPICVAQFNQDLEKDKKHKELKGKSSWDRDKYVKEQGWATMPGEKDPDSDVAEKCAEQILAIK